MSAPSTIDMTTTALAAAIATGEVSPVAAVEGALARIAAREPQVRAWAHLDAEAARAQADILAAEAKAGRSRGVLHGVPVGLKDVFHAADMPTVATSKTMDPAARYPDSGIAAALKAAGAIIIGKCETVEFAGMGIPPETRNPWNLAHTAGGSSSGSGAAVGARMIPAAIGTQTGGSNLRPAAYNGVAGFKPSYGVFPREGCLPVSWSLDHPGIITRAADDLLLIFGALAKRTVPAARNPPSWRLGLVRSFFLERSDADTVAAVEAAAARWVAAGATLVEVPLPAMFGAVQGIHRLVMNTEMATFHQTRLAADRDRMTLKHRLAVEAYSLVPAVYYLQALRARRLLRDALARLFDTVDILVMPTAPGPAPEGLDSTGDASLLSPWSLVGFPAASVPCGLASSGLPLGLQLVGPPGSDLTVLAAACAAEAVLGRLDLPA